MTSNVSSIQLAILDIGGIRISFPRNDIAGICLTTDMQTELPANNREVAWVENENYQWPVFSISKDFTILPRSSDKHRFCVCLDRKQDKTFGLTCDAVEAFELKDNSAALTLPDCMSNPISPILHVFMHNQGLIFMSNANAMRDFLLTLETVYG